METHERLRQARIEAGFTSAADAATSLGVARATYTAHENGSRGIKPGDILRYARRFRVAPEWLQFGRAPSSATAPPQPAQIRPDGFGETQIETWAPPPYATGDSLLDHLAPDARHPSAFRLNREIGAWNYSAGDVLVIDLKADKAPGDIVIASRVDADTGTAETILARLLPPYLAPPNPAEPPILIDNTLTIMGPVVASFRTKDM